MLPPLPIPPRSVIVEKIPPEPAKPPDVLIERWIPYQSLTKRKVILQRAEDPPEYPPPKNIIIEFSSFSMEFLRFEVCSSLFRYDVPETRVVRQVQRLGVTPEDPESYRRRYGETLLDSQELLAKVKQLGIDDDLVNRCHCRRFFFETFVD